MRSLRSLSFKLFVLQVTILVSAFALYTYMSSREENENALTNFLTTADRIGDVIKRSTRSAMLRNQPENVSEIVETIAGEPGIEDIRIYNKRGETIYSTGAGDAAQPVDMDAEACYGCHGGATPLEALSMEQRVRIVVSSKGYRVMGLITPIPNEPDCSSADCHAHPAEQKILGVIDVKMPLAEADAQMVSRRNNVLFLAAVVILLITTVSGFFVFFVVHKPVRKLIEGTREIASGNLDHRLDIKADDEIGHLANAFNRMTDDLKTSRDKAREWSRSLQHKTEQLENMQAQMLQAEKMVSLGRLAATVAHELNNPLAGVQIYTKLVMRTLDKKEHSSEELDSMLQSLETIASETMRCGDIVKNLLLFSRQQEANFKPERLHEVLNSSLQLVNHHLEINDIRVTRGFEASDDRVECDSNQLKQAFIALFINAKEAMPKGGHLQVSTEDITPGELIRVVVMDSGHGIPQEVVDSIFEPFFTTKSESAGVGLGLSVAYGVMKRHGAIITVESQADEGTAFIINLPCVPEVTEDEPNSERGEQ